MNTGSLNTVSVHKFGGSSLSTINRLNNVVNIISEKTNPGDFIVVSANGNVTDLLLDFSQGKPAMLEKIQSYYQALVKDLPENFADWLAEFFSDLKKLSQSTYQADEILAHGEIWSAKLLTELLNHRQIPAEFIDARKIFKSDFIEDYQAFDKNYFQQAITQIKQEHAGKRFIVTGFIAQNTVAKTVTLGRNGSDYSASLLANLATAKCVTLWTDVNGIYSADPRLVKQAHKIDFLSYDEAKALASVGTNVLHQKTISPLRKLQIPLSIRSSIEPSGVGSYIGVMTNHEQQNFVIENTKEVRSIALKENLLVVYVKNLSGAKLAELEHALFEAHINATIHRSSVLESSALESAALQSKTVLLVAEKDIQVIKHLLEKEDFSYQVDQQPCSLIAIVGLPAPANKGYAEALLENFPAEIVQACDFSAFDWVLNIVIKRYDAKPVLAQVYNYCFKAKLTSA